MKIIFSLAGLLALTAPSGFAAIIYTADFSNAGEGSTHDNSGADPLESSPVIGTNWQLTFDEQNVSSDTTTNEFITLGGVMRVQDWGGEGTITSDAINIASNGTVDITGAALTVGADVFNFVGNEGITWFYTLNGTTTSVFLDETALGGLPVDAGTDVGRSFPSVPVSAGDTLFVGFTVNVNGADDGVEVSSLDVDFIPEPTTSLLGALALIFFLRRSRPRRP